MNWTKFCKYGVPLILIVAMFLMYVTNVFFGEYFSEELIKNVAVVTAGWILGTFVTVNVDKYARSHSVIDDKKD